MPIYEYKCPSCNTVKDVLMKPGSAEIQHCDKCGTPMYKLFSAPGMFDFRGIEFSVSSKKSNFR